MPLFTVICRDRDDAGDLRAATRPAHLEWLGALGDRLRLAGPFLDGRGRSTGSLLVVEADDLGAATALAADDPYAQAELFASTAVEGWRAAVGGFGERQGVSAGARPTAGTALCRLDEIADPGAKTFAFPAAEPEGRGFQGFVVRKDGALHGYVDSCPHTGAPLAAEPDRYLDAKGAWILCWTHGAMFQIADGLCVAGPCVKRSLRPWPVEVRGEEVVAA